MISICVKLNYGTFENYPLTMNLDEPVKLKDIIEHVERTIRSSDNTIKKDDKLVSILYHEWADGKFESVSSDEDYKDIWPDMIKGAESLQTTRLLVVTENISDKGQLKKKKSKKRKKSKGKGSKGKGSKGKGSKGKGSKGKGSKSSSSRRKRKYKTIKRNK